MKKKRILYSELAPPAPAPPPDVEPAPARPADVEPERAPPLDIAPAPASPRRPSTPVDLARALAAARAAERAAEDVSSGIESMTPEIPDAEVERLAARPIRERARARSGHAELLVFCVGSERFGVELSAVEEVIDLPVIHHVPEMPPAMLGVISVRGTLTPTYSPNAALGLPLASGDAALIFRRGRARAGIVIDDVDDAATVDLAELRDAPGLDESGGVMLGVVRHAGVLLALVDADALIGACQAAPTLETA